MSTLNNLKFRYKIILSLIVFFIISIITIYSISFVSENNQILIKQTIWYLVGFTLIFIVPKKIKDEILKHSFFLYLIGNVLLFLLLIFGEEVNGSKCWFIIPGIGSFQPSEFMKLFLIFTNAKLFEIFDSRYSKKTFLNDIKIFVTITVITLIPSILTFLEPDTGMVIIYFLISYIMLFVYGVKKRIFLTIISIIIICLGMFLYLYFNYQDNFIGIFGTNFFYRIDRLLDWSNKSGMQLTNAMAAIKSAGLFGFGIGNTPIYIPEAHTDFIFSVFASNFGLIGTLVLLFNIVIFDFCLLMESKNTTKKTYKYIIIGFVSMILYQQVQNIGMNIGLLPITGITLPFISYGGSSLLSYMLGVAFILKK